MKKYNIKKKTVHTKQCKIIIFDTIGAPISEQKVARWLNLKKWGPDSARNVSQSLAQTFPINPGPAYNSDRSLKLSSDERTDFIEKQFVLVLAEDIIT